VPKICSILRYDPRQKAGTRYPDFEPPRASAEVNVAPAPIGHGWNGRGQRLLLLRQTEDRGGGRGLAPPVMAR